MRWLNHRRWSGASVIALVSVCAALAAGCEDTPPTTLTPTKDVKSDSSSDTIGPVSCTEASDCEAALRDRGLHPDCATPTCEAGFCQFPSSAFDGNACGQDEVCILDGATCDAGVCVGESPCDDGLGCTVDLCDPVTAACSHEQLPAGDSCDDGIPCTSGDRCDEAGQCVGNPGALCECEEDAECANKTIDDKCFSGLICQGYACVGDPATAVVCDPSNDSACLTAKCQPTTGDCVPTPAPDGTNCEGANPCQQNTTCQGGSCIGDDIDCDDGNPCTSDVCDPLQGCVHSAINAACDDGDACTGPDLCSAGQCAPGPQKVCDDGNVCTDDTCNPAGGNCNFEVNTAPCDDGNSCTTDDTCEFGVCQGTPGDCDDGNPCTLDFCTDNGGVPVCEAAFVSGPCDDGDDCTINEACKFGVCSGGVDICQSECVTDADCEDFDPTNLCVTVWECDPATKTCVADETSIPTCDPNKETQCTIDACIPATGECGPVSKGEGVVCDDGDPCTEDDHCTVSGVCAASPLECDDGNDCTADQCVNSQCEHLVLSDATVFVDEDFDGGLPGTWGQSGGDGTVTWKTSPMFASGGSGQGLVVNGPNGSYDYGAQKVTLQLPSQWYYGELVQIRFRVRADFAGTTGEFNKCFDNYDYFAVRVEHLGTTDQVFCLSNDQDGWKDVVVELNDFGVASTVSLVFNANPTDNNAWGVAVDDFRISGSFVCDPGIPCQTGICNAGACEPVALQCDDGDPCTTDSCDQDTGACVYEPGQCACDTVDDCDENPDPCLSTVCGPTGFCTDVFAGGSCDDGNVCTAADFCLNGVCTGTPLNCDDGDPCTLDECDDLGLGCINTFATLPCDDGDPCTFDDACVDGGGCAGQPLDCDGPCFIGTCNPDGTCGFGGVKHDGQVLEGADFDDVAPPNLPSGWSGSSSDFAWGWETSTAAADSLPNSMELVGPNDGSSPFAVVTASSPAIDVPADGGELSFRVNATMTSSYEGDCGSDVLQVMLGSTIVPGSAVCSSTGGWQTVTVPLPAGSFGGQSYDGVHFEFTTGSNTTAVVYVDEVEVRAKYLCDDGDSCTSSDKCNLGVCGGDPVPGCN